jgi:hypothetical protein
MQPNCSLLSILRVPSGMVGVSAPRSDTPQNTAITIAEDGARWPRGAGRAELDVDDRWVVAAFGTGLVRGVEPGIGGWKSRRMPGAGPVLSLASRLASGWLPDGQRDRMGPYQNLVIFTFEK